MSQVIDIISVSCMSMKLHLRDNNVEKLKKLLYDIATHLQLARDGQSCEYKYMYMYMHMYDIQL